MNPLREQAKKTSNSLLPPHSDIHGFFVSVKAKGIMMAAEVLPTCNTFFLQDHIILTDTYYLLVHSIYNAVFIRFNEIKVYDDNK